MMKSYRKIFSLVLFFIFSIPAFAIVLHPGYEPLPTWSGRPSSNVVGRWGANASCVVISPDCIVTTNHQGGGVGTVVVIGANSYTVTRVERYGTSDIRVAKLRYADLADFVAVYTGSSESNKNFVIGGYGVGRGAVLQTTGITYGYAWDGLPNTTLRWGTNKVDSIDTPASPGPLLIADFDGPSNYEAILAVRDSGGGWFMESGGQWVLIGLSYGIELHDGYPSQSWFKNPTFPAIAAPDSFNSHRVSNYAAWINTTADQLADCGLHPEDISEDCKVDIVDIKEFAKWWASNPLPSSVPRQEADVNSDTAVNMLDFAKIASQWNQNYW